MDNWLFLWYSETTRVAISAIGQIAIVLLTFILLIIDLFKTRKLQTESIDQKRLNFLRGDIYESVCFGKCIKDYKNNSNSTIQRWDRWDITVYLYTNPYWWAKSRRSKIINMNWPEMELKKDTIDEIKKYFELTYL